jgi:hypothetical protein
MLLMLLLFLRNIVSNNKEWHELEKFEQEIKSEIVVVFFTIEFALKFFYIILKIKYVNN